VTTNAGNFLQMKFREYYKDHGSKIPSPTSIERREFGFLLFKEGLMTRHRSFKSINELGKTLVDLGPSDVYYSAAYYDYPTENMDKKGWRGSNLIFDIDADHLESDCRRTHIVWICKRCQRTGVDQPPSRCPECGGRIHDTYWICEECLEATKRETIKLVDFLTNDFGFSHKDMLVCFSGNRGYHIHVEEKNVTDLDQLARKEIVDYLRGTGLEMGLHGLSEEDFTSKKIDPGPDLTDPGWRGRMARAVHSLLSRTSVEELVNQVGLPRRTAETVVSGKDDILESWRSSPPWHAVVGVGAKSWEKIVQFAIKRQTVNIDTVVTSDIHRLIRLPETLHGKTGFRTAIVPLEELDRFNPLSDAQAFGKKATRIYVMNSPEFRLGGEDYGPFKDERVDLPAEAAIMLMCKGLAVPHD